MGFGDEQTDKGPGADCMHARVARSCFMGQVLNSVAAESLQVCNGAQTTRAGSPFGVLMKSCSSSWSIGGAPRAPKADPQPKVLH